MVKYVFVTGGVVSGLGKGITAASLGRLLKARGYKVTMQKFDPYLNIDPGAMDPIQHGEVFVTDDGAETDLDLGHYERFIDVALDKRSTMTSGKIYWSLLNKQRRGDYGGGTVQVIPHITNEIKSNFYKSSEALKEVENYKKKKVKANEKNTEIAIIEVGGTVGDIESQPHFETIRQFKAQLGNENCILVHVVLIPYLHASEELKTKPAQMSVKTLQGIGIQPDILVCRSEFPLDQSVKNKLSLFCNLHPSRIIENPNVEVLYEIPLVMEKQGLATAAIDALELKDNKANLSDWKKMVEHFKYPEKDINVALVGKYTALHDAYLSVAESLKAAGAFYKTKVHIKWIDSEEIERKGSKKILSDVNAIIAPGGFGKQGTLGIVDAIKYARENKIPFLGICLGMQLALIEIARNVLKLKGADSTELIPDTPYPVVDIMQDNKGVGELGDTLRLGSYTCVLDKNSKVYKLYGKQEVAERHRNRYEVNNDYKDKFIKNGVVFSGLSPDGKMVEMIELKDHPFFVGVLGHPEYKSRPNNPHPLFKGFIESGINNAKKHKK